MPRPFVEKEQSSQETRPCEVVQRRVEASAEEGLLCPVGVDLKELPGIETEEYPAIPKGWRRWGARDAPTPYRARLGLRAALGSPNGLSRPTFRLGGRVHMASPRQAGPLPSGGEVWPFSRPDPPESGLGGQRPGTPLVHPSSPAQPLQLIHGDRQVGDRRQAPGGWRAEQRLHDGLWRRRGAAGEEQAAAVRGLRAQFHGCARPPGAPALSASASAAPAPPRRHWPRPRAPPPAPAGQTQTRPRGSGTRRPRASGADGRVSGPGRRRPHARVLPPRPARPAGGRAPATSRLNPNKRSGSERAARAGRQRPGLTLSSLLAQPGVSKT